MTQNARLALWVPSSNDADLGEIIEVRGVSGPGQVIPTGFRPQAGAGAGIEEAPADGKHYVRQDLDWAIGVGEAPSDSQHYARRNTAWAAVVNFPEAPIDSTVYGRQNAAWVPVPGGDVEEAPIDGDIYGRQDGAWTTIPVPDVTKAYVDAADATKEPGIAPGTTAQYWRGDKSWQTLPAPGIGDAPSDGQQYARKNAAWDVVTGGGGGGAAITSAETPPAGAADNSLWWESDTGILYLKYNDGSSTQWVQAAGAAVGVGNIDPTLFVDIAGDTMTGHLSLPTGPAAANAVRKDYVDGADATLASAITAGDALKVAKTGDTMTGDLQISRTNPAIVLNRAAGANANSIYGNISGSARWVMTLGSSDTESGGNLGSGFGLYSFSDAGAYIGRPLYVQRTGEAIFSGPIQCLNLQAAGGVFSIVTTTTGTFYFGSGGTRYIHYDGANLSCTGTGGFYLPGLLQAPGGVLAAGYRCKPGFSGGYRANWFEIDYGGNAGLYIDETYMGIFQYVSDYRLKKDVVDLPGTWAMVKALRPIKYSQKEFSPPSHDAFRAQQKVEAAKLAKEGGTPEPVSDAPLIPNDDTEQWGFIAHELQETLTPSAASSVKDAPDAIQSPNPWTIIAALTKTIQEMQARIEALEAAA